MSGNALLSVNIDHVATVRQARRAPYPDPVAAAAIAEEAGAHGITVHLRSDRRHVQDDDVRRLRGSVSGKLNLEMAATEEMIGIALELRPGQVTLVPERPEEVTTEGGLDLGAFGDEIAAAAARLREAGIEVSLFLDPSAEQIERLAGIRAASGFEINTDRYTKAAGAERDAEFDRITACANRGAELGFRVYAGHGLTTDNVGPVAALGPVEELNIGHFIVSRAVLVGLKEAVGEMLAAIG